jgi:hypothetical protein
MACTSQAQQHDSTYNGKQDCPSSPGERPLDCGVSWRHGFSEHDWSGRHDVTGGI